MTSGSQGPVATIWRLLGFARPYLWVIALAVLFSLLYAGGIVGRAALIEPLFDGIAIPAAKLDATAGLFSSVVPESDAATREIEREQLRANIDQSFTRILLAGLLLVLGMPLVRLVRDYASDWVMTRLLVDLQRSLGGKLLRLPLGRHNQDSSGEFLTRVTSDTALANGAQALIFGSALQNLAVVVVAIAAAFWINWRLALVTLVVGPPIGVILQVFGPRIRHASGRRQQQTSEVLQRLVRILGGIKVIKAFRAEEREQRELEGEMQRYFRRAMGVVRNRIYSRVLVEAASQFAIIALLLVGIWALLGHSWGVTIGELGAFVFISAALYSPMKSLTRSWNAIQDALPPTLRIFEILDADEEPPDAEGSVQIEELRHGISFQQVGFSYGRECVIDDVSFEIAAGQVVALVGRTGSGKTTLADLLLGFYEPDSGSISIDGVDLRNIKRHSLRELSATVTQEAFLFDTTILENIRYGRPDATREQVIAAAQTANAHEFIQGLPSGYDTPVGERGSQLSGGQRQRLTIARAVLRDPQLLIFDEATSALDAHTEQLVQSAIRRLMHKRTVLLIAHRLSTVRAADRIIVLEDGKVTMTGTHEELLQKTGLYRELVELQLVELPSEA
ncbi:MAG: ABC transporter ATP-binding protein [Myxococcales bacterium]|nr:ABC transporter ATP-binding protein [Myxococcales bacterium]